MDTKSVGQPRDTRTLIGSSNLRRADKVEAEEKKASRTSQSKEYGLNISSEALELARAREKALDIARSTSDIREERVAELKNKINSGEYKIDAGKIADGILMEAIRDELATNSKD